MCNELNLNKPKFFDNELFLKYGTNANYVLSTSCLGYWNACGGVPPMTEDGYAIFYAIQDESMHFTVITYKSCKTTDSVQQFDEISNALLDIKSIITKANL